MSFSLIATWTSWSAWSRCSLTCGGGYRQQTRQCEPDGGGCGGSPTKTGTCNSQKCCKSRYFNILSKFGERAQIYVIE